MCIRGLDSAPFSMNEDCRFLGVHLNLLDIDHLIMGTFAH
jgi:hypothetical protein